jgi:hypothetical protein
LGWLTKMKNRIISVESEMTIPREAVKRPVTHRDCNNIPTSTRQLDKLKIYAELDGIKRQEVEDKKLSR